MNTARAYMLAWRHAAKVPQPLLRAIVAISADIIWLKRGKGIARMEKNYARVRPDLSSQQIRRLSRRGARSYFRYFAEAFTLHHASADQIAARVRIVNPDYVKEVTAGKASAVLALGHLGNWDLAGAWAAQNLAPVLTVAEKLQPEELYQEFVAFRKSIGIEVLGLGDPGVFRELVRGASTRHCIVPLLADRDLSKSGVEVSLCGRPARVAAGPATLAMAAKVDLVPTMITYERLYGQRRRKAGTPWGLVVEFYPPIATPPRDPDLPGSQASSQQVVAMTQGWVTAMENSIVRFTQDWHMMQRVFSEDLDLSGFHSHAKQVDDTLAPAAEAGLAAQAKTQGSASAGQTQQAEGDR